MPLVRLQVRNEYGQGQPELYARPNGKEDPKAVLDGLAVAGLVGILRQLGDLAEFAAEVFHGLQEQVMTTASRSHNLMVRVQHIETALPPLEKVVLAQTSHIHFAYTPGSEWHPRIRSERNHFIYNDLPHFIMDSYEECRGPPRLHLLDKFDTGGPGSCLKRYSDPTFFKRVSARPDEANTEKVQRDRKARRSKKKRPSKQNGDVSRGASVSNAHNYSMQFVPPITDGRSSPSQTASTVDTGLKYDLGDNLHSFDSRAESGYIECVFHPSSSAQAEEQEPMDSPTFKTVPQNDALDSVFLNEDIGYVDDHFPRSSLHEQLTSTSSCVTWDEKAEIMEPKILENNSMDETLYLQQHISDVDAHSRGDGNYQIIDQMEMCGGDNIRESVSSQSGIDEIESEPDNYMDALNTIELESENDLDYQAKRELERFSSISNNEGTGGVDELTVRCSDHHPVAFESHTDSLISSNKEVLSDLPDSIFTESCGHEQMPASDISSDKEVPSDLPNLCSLESHASEQTPQIARESFTDNSAAITRNADTLHGSELGSVTAEPPSSATKTTEIQYSFGDKAVSSLCDSQESPTDISSNSSIRIWTNGGLLGLEPSKPPDFSMSSPIARDYVSSSKANIVGPLEQTHMPKDKEHRANFNLPAENTRPREDDDEDGISTKKTSQGILATCLDSTPGKTGDLQMQNGFGNSRANDLKEISMLGTGKVLPVAPSVNYSSTETNQDNDETSSLVFGLSRRLLSNGLGRRLSDISDSKLEAAGSTNDNLLEQKSEHHRVANQIIPEKVFREQFEYESAVSATASPPLEHMKISFHPIDGSEASKLKLKFSDGTQSHASIRDMFPSFQLIPEASIHQHDYGSDSDDDTFCRSSPFMSDDCLSRHSESNSEQWECGDSTDGKDHEVYDALCGISSMELVPSSLELDGMPNNSIFFDGGIGRVDSGIDAKHSFSNPILDLPSFDAVKPALRQETGEDSDEKNLLAWRCLSEPSPTQPPLPPMQWRVSKLQMDMTENTPDAVSESFKHALGLKLLSSAATQQPKPIPEGQQHNNEAPVIQPKIKDQQKSNMQKEFNNAANGKGMDEREDFLQQIRAKSFNLRPTVTAKLTTASGPTASFNVSAILEKANAIRQAVASDDGEDDNWSDT